MTSEQPPTEPTPSSDATTADTTAADTTAADATAADATAADATAETPAPPAAPAAPEATPPTAPPPPSGAPVATASGGGFRIGPGQIITAVGAIAVGVACFLEWLQPGNGARSAKADIVPWDFFWNKTSTSDTSILVWLIPIAVLIAIAALVPQLRFVGLVGGVAALAVAGLYAFQLNELIDSFHADVGSVYDHIGIGDYVVAGGGFLAIVGTLVPRAPRSSA